MRMIKALATLPLWLVLVAATPTPTPTATVAASPAASPTPSASPSPSPSPSPTPTPAPTPTPVNAAIGLDPTAGGPSIGITVTGQLFLPGEAITLYWDDPSRVAGTAQADSSGAFRVVVKAFPGDQPGVHHLYASVPPRPRADFLLEGPPSPTPAVSPTPSDSPTPSPSPTESPTESPSPSALPVAGISGIDIITRPPFVFLPIVGALGLLGVLAYWALSNRGRGTTSALPASVVHRTIRPDYGAPYGTPAAPPAVTPIPPPVEPPAAAPPPIASPPVEAPPPPPPQAFEPPPAPAPPEPTVEWPSPPPLEPPGAPDAPPDLPEPSE